MEAKSFEQYQMLAARQENEGAGNEWRSQTLLGEAPNLGVAEVDIQPQAGTTVLPSAAGTLSLVSTSANDIFGGTGVNAVLIQALDGEYGNGGQDLGQLFYEEIILMGGLTPVTASVPLLRHITIRNVASGVLGTSDGTVTSDINGDDQLVLRPGDGQSKSTRTTCPAGWVGYSGFLVVNWAGNQSTRINCSLSFPNGTVFANIQTDFERSLENRLGANPLSPTVDVNCTALRVGGGGTDPLDVILPFVFHRTIS